MSSDYIKKPKVSILLPSYNVVDYIRECIESVLAQTLREIEVLCIDAGSEDGTADIIREYERKDTRLRYIKSDLKSYGYQMNLGIREARAPYIGIVETDDYIDNNMFKSLYNAATLNKVDFVKSIAFDIYDYDDGKRGRMTNSYLTNPSMVGKPFSPDSFPEVHNWDGNIWNGLYSKELITDNNILFQETMGAAFQDIGFQHQILNHAKKALFIPYRFYQYRKVRKGASTWTDKCIHYFWSEYRNLLENHLVKESHLPALYKRIVPTFFYEYQKALTYNCYDISKLNYFMEVKWFKDIFQKGIRNLYISRNSVGDYDWERLMIFLSDDERQYADWWKNKEKPAVEWQKDFNNKIGNRELLIFGCGKYGIMQLKLQMRNGHVARALIDNSSDMMDKAFFDTKVLNPYEAAVMYPDAFYLVAAKNTSDEMKQQLMELGISEKQIFVYDGADKELNDFLMTAPFLLCDN